MTSFDGFDDLADDLDDLADEFDEIAERAEELEGENEVPLSELFPEEFMRKHTSHNSVEEFFDSSPWTVESEEDLEEIPDEEFDEYVQTETNFEDEEAMTDAAVEEYVARQLGL